MTIFFALIFLGYGVMVLHKAITFEPANGQPNERVGYAVLLVGMSMLCVSAGLELMQSSTLVSAGTFAGIALAVAGLLIINVRLWRARLQGDIRQFTNKPVRYHAAICVMAALPAGFFVAPVLEPLLSKQSVGWILLSAAIIGGAMLTGALFSSGAAYRSQPDKGMLLRWLGYPSMAFLALTIAMVFRFGYDGAQSVHPTQAALAFALLVMAGLAAALLDGRIRLRQ